MFSTWSVCTHRTTLFSIYHIIKRNTQQFAEYVTISTCEGLNQAIIYMTDSPEQFTVSNKRWLRTVKSKLLRESDPKRPLKALAWICCLSLVTTVLLEVSGAKWKSLCLSDQ